MAWWTKAYKEGKDIIKKREEKNIADINKNAETIKKMTEGLDAKNLKMLKNKVGDVFKSSPGVIRKWLKRLGIIGGVGGGGAYVGSSWERAKQMGKDKEELEKRSKGGYVKMKRGGSVKKRAKSSSKKARGTGAAIKGTKFKGVF